MLTDIEIAQSVEMQPITKIAAAAGIDDKYLEQYGKYKAKISPDVYKKVKDNILLRSDILYFLRIYYVQQI